MIISNGSQEMDFIGHCCSGCVNFRYEKEDTEQEFSKVCPIMDLHMILHDKNKHDDESLEFLIPSSTHECSMFLKNEAVGFSKVQLQRALAYLEKHAK